MKGKYEKSFYMLGGKIISEKNGLMEWEVLHNYRCEDTFKIGERITWQSSYMRRVFYIMKKIPPRIIAMIV